MATPPSTAPPTSNDLDAPVTTPGGLGKEVVTTTVMTAVLLACGFANSVVVARTIGAEGRGVYSVLVAMAALTSSAAALGLPQAATWQIGRRSDAASVVALQHMLFAILCVLGVLGAAWFWEPPVADHPPSARLLGAATCVIAPAMVYNELNRGLLLGLRRVGLYNSVYIVSAVSLLLANLFLLGRGAEWVLVTLAIGHWVPAACGLAIHARRAPAARWPPLPMIRESLRFGTKAGVAAAADSALARVDYLLMAPAATASQLGLYSTADQSVGLITALSSAGGRLMLAESANDPQGVQARRKLGHAFRLTVGLTAVAAGFVGSTAWFMIPMIFGEEFRASYLGILVLMPVPMLVGLQTLLTTYLMGQGVSRPAAVGSVLALIVKGVGTVAAAPTLGWLGVAGVRVVSHLVGLSVAYAAYQRSPGAEPMGCLPRSADWRLLWDRVVGSAMRSR